MNDINRSVIIDYLSYLNKQRSSPGTRATRISDLAVFFEAGTINKWFNLSPYLIRKRLSSDTKVPRYIPEEVMYQLNHLDELPESVMRMVLVIQECGLRVGEPAPIKLLETRCKGRMVYPVHEMESKNRNYYSNLCRTIKSYPRTTKLHSAEFK